ncbi:MAG TPA: hypothetical protein VF032_02115 [Thermoleophilaceae bacterium]
MSTSAGGTGKDPSPAAIEKSGHPSVRLPSTLRHAEAAVVAAALGGETARPGRRRSSPPDVETGAGWDGRTIRASVLAELCTARDAQVQARGVCVAGARIEGALDLQSAKLRVPLTLDGCRIEKRVLLEDAEAPAITFRNCCLADGVAAGRLRTDGSLTLSGSVIEGGVDVFDAHIGGDLDCRDMCLRGSGDEAGFAAMGIEVGADVGLQGCTVDDTYVNFDEATVGRSVYADGASLHRETGEALSLYGAEIRGDLQLPPGPSPCQTDPPGEMRRFSAHGSLNLARVQVGLIDCRGARLDTGDSTSDSAVPDAVNLWGAKVTRDIWIHPWVSVDGEQNVVRAEIEGDLNITGAVIEGDVTLSGARFSTGGIIGNRAEVRGTLGMTLLQDVEGRALRDADGELMRFEAFRAWLAGSRLGEVQAQGARLGGRGATAFDLSSSSVTGSITLDAWLGDDSADAPIVQRSEFRGTVNLHAARVGAVGARGTDFITTSGASALSLWAARVTGDVDLGTQQARGSLIGTSVDGNVEMARALIEGDLVCQGISVRGIIKGAGLQAPGRVLFGCAAGTGEDGAAELLRTTIEGGIAMTGSRLGEVDLSGAKIVPPTDQVALDLSEAAISGDLEFNPLVGYGPDPMCSEAQGSVVLSGATLDGTIYANGARLMGQPDALRADDATISGDVRLGRALVGGLVLQDSRGYAVRFEASGATSFFNATLKAQLTCRGGRFSNPGGDALSLYGTEIAGDALLDEVTERFQAPERLPYDAPALRFEAEGRLQLMAARVGHNLSLRGARISNSRGVFNPADYKAIDATGLNVVSHLALDRLDATGQIDLTSASVGILNCADARLRFLDDNTPPDTPVFEGHYLRVANEFTWQRVQTEGAVSLAHASVGSLRDDLPSWPAEATELQGFAYGALASNPGWKERAAWLERQPVPVPQPYRQLAAHYHSIGDDRSARKVNMERFNVHLRRPEPGRRLARAWRWMLRLSIGHGYEPWRALPILLVVVGIVWGTTALAARKGNMVPTKPGVSTRVAANDCARRDYPCLQPLLYAADVVVPVLDFGQKASWRQAGGLGYRLVSPFGTFLGWFLTTLVIAGFTGVVRRE